MAQYTPVTLDKQVLLLQRLVNDKLDRLTPKSNLQSPFGFIYPEAHEIFSGDPGTEIAQLDQLADIGCFEKQFVDRVHLCSVCQHFALNFRETCTRCSNSNIELSDILHHYRCGFTAPEEQFKEGIKYNCPKCKQNLRHIGVDYERSSASYVCKSCSNVFVNPKVSYNCLNCGNTSDAENAITRTMYSYQITPQGMIAASEGSLNSVAKTRGIIEPNLSLFTASFFEARLVQELAEVRRYKRTLSVVMLVPDKFTMFQEKYGVDVASSLYKNLVSIVKEQLRDSDVAAIYKANIIVLLMPDTPLTGAFVAADRIKKVFQQQYVDYNATLSMGMANSSPTQFLDAEQILESSMQSLEEAQHKGGNLIRPTT